jgi:hypothetical protein
VSSTISCSPSTPAMYHAGSCSTPKFPPQTVSVSCYTLCQYDM